MSSYEVINHVMVTIFNQVMDIEQKAIITDEFSDITNNDMHIIEAIGIEEPRNMSTIAKELRVTTGTLTISMNNLVKKGYADRTRSEKDRRVVYITLTEKGRKAYAHHAEFHKKMIESMIAGMEKDDLDILANAMHKLEAFFEDCQKKQENL